MIPPLKSLLKIINKVKEESVNVFLDQRCVIIRVDLKKVSYQRISPFLYLTLNKFENLYLILIEGVPFCLMPDATDHLIYQKMHRMEYQKDAQCQKCKYGRFCPGWPRDSKIKQRPLPVPDLPQEIAFEVTTKCNLNCPLCFRAKTTMELPLNRIKTLINECQHLGIRNIRFTGGEPLLYKNIGRALNYARNKNLYVTINTNATSLNKENVRILEKCADDILISMQGFNQASEEKLTRSPTNFKQKLCNINRLNTGLLNVRLGTIISKTLIKNFPKYLYLAQSLQIKNWQLYRPMSDVNWGDYNISEKDFRKLIKLIGRSKKHRMDIKIANALPFCITKDTKLSHHVLAGADFDDGHQRLIVDARGHFKPSYFIFKNLGASIKTAWQNPFMKELRALNYLPVECQKCFSLRWCKGGSRQWAKIANGHYFSRDPLMKHQ